MIFTMIKRFRDKLFLQFVDCFRAAGARVGWYTGSLWLPSADILCTVACLFLPRAPLGYPAPHIGCPKSPRGSDAVVYKRTQRHFTPPAAHPCRARLVLVLFCLQVQGREKIEHSALHTGHSVIFCLAVLNCSPSSTSWRRLGFSRRRIHTFPNPLFPPQI